MDENIVDSLRIEVQSDSSKAVKGLDNVVSALERVKNIAASVSKTLDPLLSKLDKLGSSSGTAGGASKLQALSSKIAGGSSAPAISTSTSPLNGETLINPSTVSGATDSVGALNDALGETLSTSEALKAIGAKAFSGFKIGAKAAGTQLKAFGKKLSKLFQMFSRRLLYRAMNAVISTVTNSLKEGVQAVYQYSKALGGEFASTMDRLATNANQLKGALGAMAAPMIMLFTPALEKTTEWIINTANSLNQLFASLAGQEYWLRAVKVETEYQKATEGVIDANEQLKKSVLGIDELNTLSDNSKNAFGYEFVQEPIDSARVEEIKNKLKQILWYVVAIGTAIKGWRFGDALADLTKLKGLKSLSATVGITLSVTGLVFELKGAIDMVKNGITAKNLAETLLGSGAVIGGAALVGAAFGNAALGAAIGAIIAGIAAYGVGIWDAIKDGLDWLNAALIGAGATLAGAGVGAIIGMVGGPIGAGIGALIGLAVGALTDLTILIVQNWDAIVAWFSKVFSDIGRFFSKLWKKISTWASDCWDAIVSFFSPAIEWFGNLFGSIGQTVSDVFYNIGVLAKGCWDVVKAVWGVVSSWFNDKVFQPVSKFFTNLWNGFVEKAKKAWEGVKSVFSTVGEFFGNTFRNAWAKIVKVFSVAGEIFVDIKNGVVNAFKKVVNGLITGINKVVSVPFKGINSALSWLRDIEILGLSPFSGLRSISIPEIPLLAEGGQVNTGQLFIAREAGAELVGSIGGRTSVANNEQIVEGISEGVREANTEMVSALFAVAQQLMQTIRDKDTNIYLDSERVAKSVTQSQNRVNRMYGIARQNV